MTRIAFAFTGILLTLFALWLGSAPFAGLAVDVWPWREALIQGTGTLGIGVMSVALVLATRPVIFEPALGGLDKMYRLHKWLGIAGLVLVVGHWLGVQVPKWLVGLGWLTRPAESPIAVPAGSVLQQLHRWRDAAQGIGEAAFYAFFVLIALALLKRFPYRRFFQTHRLLPVVYLALVFHAVVLTQDSTWTGSLGLALAALLLAGTLAALTVLFGDVARDRQAVGVVDAVTLNAALAVLEVAVRLKSRWPGHAAGQFAFVRFASSPEPHPFTISSAWMCDGRMVFFIKGLGDNTRQLPARLKVGDLVRVEGPYGRFNFDGATQRQIWVGGGIGITPFIARLKELALQPDGKHVDLFQTSATADAVASARLKSLALEAHVGLHQMVDAVDGRLSANKLCATVPDWRSADVWFCGPAAFGRALRRDLLAKGLLARNFHQELFNLR
jgi:predicted ferric reductase